MQRINRGDIYYANLDPVVGSEQGGTRPVLIVQNDNGNKYSPTVIVAPITSRRLDYNLPTHYKITHLNILSMSSVVLLEQLRTIDKQRLMRYVATLDYTDMADIEQALQISVGIYRREPMIMCLCGTCASFYYESNDYDIRRVDPNQKSMDICTYCNVRRGYDYEIYVRK